MFSTTPYPVFPVNQYAGSSNKLNYRQRSAAPHQYQYHTMSSGNVLQQEREVPYTSIINYRRGIPSTKEQHAPNPGFLYIYAHPGPVIQKDGYFLHTTDVVRSLAPGIRLSAQCPPPRLTGGMQNPQTHVTQAPHQYQYLYPSVVTGRPGIPVILNSHGDPHTLKPPAVPDMQQTPGDPIMMKPPGIPVIMTSPTETGCILETSTSHQAQPGVGDPPDVPAPVADCSPSTHRFLSDGLHRSVPLENSGQGSAVAENTHTLNDSQMITFTSEVANVHVPTAMDIGNPESLQSVSAHQSESNPAVQQLTDPAGSETGKCFMGDQQPVGVPATCHSVTEGRVYGATCPPKPQRNTHDIPTNDTNQPINSANDESTTTDVTTTLQCKNIPMVNTSCDVKEGAERTANARSQGLLIEKEDKQNNSSESGPGTAEGDHADTSSTTPWVVPSTAGKPSGKNVRHKSDNVVVSISETTYFMSRKRWRLLHKQWYLAYSIKYMKLTAIKVSE